MSEENTTKLTRENWPHKDALKVPGGKACKTRRRTESKNHRSSIGAFVLPLQFMELRFQQPGDFFRLALGRSNSLQVCRLRPLLART